MAKRRWKSYTDDERSQEYRKRGEKGGFDFIQTDLPQFKPREGSNCVRIVPPLEDDNLADIWGVNVSYFWIDGEGGVLSPKTFNPRAVDPIDREFRRLKQKHGELEGIRPGRCGVVYILDLVEDEKGNALKVWGAPMSILDEFTRLARNKRTGAITSLEDPRDGIAVWFDRKGAGINTEYVGYELDSEPFELDDRLLDQIEYFEDLLFVESDERLQELADSLVERVDGKGRQSEQEPRRGSQRSRRYDEEEEDERPARGRSGRSRRDEEEEPEEEPEEPRRGRGGGRSRRDEEEPRRSRGGGRSRRDEEEEDEEPRRGRGGGRYTDDEDSDDRMARVRERVRERVRGRS